MRKKLTTFLFLFLFSLTLNAQNVDYSNEELIPILCKSWKMDYVFFSGMKMIPPPDLGTLAFSFKEDGTYQNFTDDIAIVTTGGVWEFISSKKLIQLHIDGRLIGSITELDKESMTLKLSPDGENGVPDEIISHFTPLNKGN